MTILAHLHRKFLLIIDHSYVTVFLKAKKSVTKATGQPIFRVWQYQVRQFALPLKHEQDHRARRFWQVPTEASHEAKDTRGLDARESSAQASQRGVAVVKTDKDCVKALGVC